MDPVETSPLSPRAPQSRQGSGAQSPAPPPRTSPRDEYLRANDLRDFVERNRHRLHDPETAYYVSQALEECAVAREPAEDEDLPADERRAASTLARQCSGFHGDVIDPARILELLRYAAHWGEPHAQARLLLLRDVAAPKDDALPELPWMLASREPSIVRDVGAFLSRGEAERRYGDDRVPTAVAAIAWELVACDLDRWCLPESRFALAQCASLGRCSDWRYEDAVARLEPPELMEPALRLREGILRALRERDWEWLGLD